MQTLTHDRDAELRRTASRRVLRVLCVSAAILCIPAVAMRFTPEVDWGPLDFIVAAVLLCGTGLVYELAVQRIGKRTHRIAGGLALGAALLLAWAELAVGVFH